MKIGFIGLGNMANAIIGGILGHNLVEKEQIIGYDPFAQARDKTKQQFQISIEENNGEVAAQSDILFLAVKPQYILDAIDQIRHCIKEDTIIVSIAAGKTLEFLEKGFVEERKIVRCMPNTPAFVGEACTGVCCNPKVNEKDQQAVLTILNSFGKASIVPENLMDAVVGVSGSSPAYVFIFIEAMADAAVAAGMPRAQAYEFAAQAVLGSAKMVLEMGKHPGELKDMVCSPGGTTIEAVKKLEEKGFRSAVMEAMAVCIEKSKNL